MTKIKLLILDVDGVLTDGGLPYEAEGSEAKVFHVQDGAAIRRWQAAGGLVALISGRQAPSVTGRAKDLGVAFVEQDVRDKLPVYLKVCTSFKLSDAEVAFVGDDLMDLGPMRRCGYPIAVGNAVAAVKRAARYVTRRFGGEGAVGEAIERLMRHNGIWSEVLRRYGSSESEA